MRIFSILIILFVILGYTPSASAGMKIGGYQMGHLGIGQGTIYSKSEFPVSVAADINNENEDLLDLTSGNSKSRNFFKLVEVGNAGIHKAVKRGGLKRISIVTTRIHKINIPLFVYVPLYYKETKTVVYGNSEEDL